MNTKQSIKPLQKSSKASSDSIAITLCKKAQTQSLEGQSNLVYHIGRDADGQLYWCLVENDGGGYFSDEWVSAEAITAALQAWASDKPITSIALQGLFTGKSANNRSFLLAALVAEGVLVRLESNKRHYAVGDLTGYQAALTEPA